MIKTIAYIDPGTGGLMVQMLIAGILGTGFVCRNYIKKLFSLGRKKDSEDVNPSTEKPERKDT